MSDQFFTPSGVRLRPRVQRPGNLNWLLLPGGPGIGSESLHELADTMDVPGTIWMVDLPGDGSNIAPPEASSDPFATWPHVLIEAAQALPHSVYVGHSTGGMYLLSVPELENHIEGLVLISTAPNANWRPYFFAMTQQNPLPAVDASTQKYESEKTNENLRDLAVASAEWNFTPQSVAVGRELLRRMPYNHQAVDWSDHAFDDIYVSKWWPQFLPTLILSGAQDRIVLQTLWNHPEFAGPNVMHKTVEDAAHFLWIEQPDAVCAAFHELTVRITSAR